MIYKPSTLGRVYGYKRSRLLNPFARKFGLRITKDTPPIPPKVDLTPQCPPVVDQGSLGSCTANALAGAFEFELMRIGSKVITPSRLFIYWNERSMEGTTSQDSGAFGGDGITSLQNLGVCDESVWPYDVSQFAVQPPQVAFEAAVANKVLGRETCETLDDIKHAVAQNHLVPFGITIYESFESPEVAQTGVVPDPLPTEAVLGGHEICIVGYDDEAQRFTLRNSWGTGWGMSGYFTASYGYVMAAGDDYEVITAVN